MGKKRFFLQFENTNGLSIKNPYLNSFVCLLVFLVVYGAIESDSVRESNGTKTQRNRSQSLQKPQ